MKALLTIAACLMMASAANAADISDDTLALLGVDSMTVVSDADGLEIRGQGSGGKGGKGHGGKGHGHHGGGKRKGKGKGGKGGNGGPVIYQKETTKFIDFALAYQRTEYSSEAKAIQFSYGHQERVTYIGPGNKMPWGGGHGGGHGAP